MGPLEFFCYILGANVFYVGFIIMIVTKSRDYKELTKKINENMPLSLIFFALINLCIWLFGLFELALLWSIIGLFVIIGIGACIFIPAKKHEESLRERIEELKEKEE